MLHLHYYNTFAGACACDGARCFTYIIITHSLVHVHVNERDASLTYNTFSGACACDGARCFKYIITHSLVHAHVMERDAVNT